MYIYIYCVHIYIYTGDVVCLAHLHCISVWHIFAAYICIIAYLCCTSVLYIFIAHIYICVSHIFAQRIEKHNVSGVPIKKVHVLKERLGYVQQA